jgi:hypothetical protein
MSRVPQVAPFVRVPLAGLDADKLASAVAHHVASARARLAASPANPTQSVASAIARKIVTPEFHVASGVLVALASSVAGALAHRLTSPAPLKTQDVDASKVLGGAKVAS